MSPPAPASDSEETPGFRYDPPHSPLRPVFVDRALVVLNKPAGLLSVPGRGDDRQDCLLTRAVKAFGKLFVVHRLDLDTSGLLLFARSARVQSALSRQFQQREIDKRYLAWVAGTPADSSGLIDLPLCVDWPNRPRQIVDFVNGRPSQTRWQRLAALPDGRASLLALAPITGRSHQLRVHLQALGHPILGDPLYASDAGRAAASRLLLHAERLRLIHPDEGQPLSLLACPDPAAFATEAVARACSSVG